MKKNWFVLQYGKYSENKQFDQFSHIQSTQYLNLCWIFDDVTIGVTQKTYEFYMKFSFQRTNFTYKTHVTQRRKISKLNRTECVNSQKNIVFSVTFRLNWLKAKSSWIKLYGFPSHMLSFFYRITLLWINCFQLFFILILTFFILLHTSPYSYFR